jgi:hypothetical protein
MHARTSLISRWALALGMVLLELLVVGHMALERHTVSTAGAVVELHASLDLHAHSDRSLCERDAASDTGWGDTPCHGTPETLVLTPDAPPPARIAAGLVLSPRADESHAAVVALWLTAPKASPPAKG